MADQQGGAANRIEALVGFASSVLAPLSVVSGLLFYFGYVSSRALYEYFGVDVDTVGLSTQDYVMRSPRPLLVPLLVLAVAGVAFSVLHGGLRRRLDVLLRHAEDDDPVAAGAGRERLVQVRRWARSVVLAGQVLMLTGVGLLFSYPALSEWPPYPLVTALLLAIGSALAAYGLRIEGLLGRHERTRVAESFAIYVVLVASLLWATATVAQWSGRGSARYLAVHLDTLPGVILDTGERLYLTTDRLDETRLPTAEGQTFRYRYRRLRLLIQGKDHLFLVPDRWSASNSTIMVPADDHYRLEFRFQSDPPG
jgi:hypothetical protein